MRFAQHALYAVSALVLVLGLSLNSWAADPVPVPCPPKCTVDPCILAPERCKVKGGPLTHTNTEAPKAEDAAHTQQTQDDEDSCKWCTPCSKTPGSECLSCCAGK